MARMRSSLQMLTKMSGQSTVMPTNISTDNEFIQTDLNPEDITVIKANFVGNQQFVVMDEDQMKAILQQAQAYTDTAIAQSGHLTEITTTKGGGLEVTDNNHIDIDDEVVFIIDCDYEENKENTDQ